MKTKIIIFVLFLALLGNIRIAATFRKYKDINGNGGKNVTINAGREINVYDVIGEFRNNYELFALEENGSEVFRDPETNGDRFIFILRYRTTVSFKMEDMEITENKESDGKISYMIKLGEPNVDIKLNDYVKDIEKIKSENIEKSGKLPGWEIYSCETNFKLGEAESIIDKELERIKKNQEKDMKEKAIRNASEKLTDFCKSFDVKIKEVTID